MIEQIIKLLNQLDIYSGEYDDDHIYVCGRYNNESWQIITRKILTGNMYSSLYKPTDLTFEARVFKTTYVPVVEFTISSEAVEEVVGRMFKAIKNLKDREVKEAMEVFDEMVNGLKPAF